MRARTLLLRMAAVAAVGITLAGCSGGASSSTGGSSGSSPAAAGEQSAQPLPKVTPPASPPVLPAGFPEGTYKNAKATLELDKNGTVKVTIGGKSGTALYTASDNEITFQGDDGGVCDSPATYSYKLTGTSLTLIQTTVDLCDARSSDFTSGPLTKG